MTGARRDHGHHGARGRHRSDALPPPATSAFTSASACVLPLGRERLVAPGLALGVVLGVILGVVGSEPGRVLGEGRALERHQRVRELLQDLGVSGAASTHAPCARGSEK